MEKAGGHADSRKWDWLISLLVVESGPSLSCLESNHHHDHVQMGGEPRQILFAEADVEGFHLVFLIDSSTRSSDIDIYRYLLAAPIGIATPTSF